MRAGSETSRGPAFAPGPSVVWNEAGSVAEIETLLTMPVATNEAYAALDRLRDELVPTAFAGTGSG